ncbi:MAG TPA: hypothetical protein VMB80_10405 [Candidatus Acidoferrum sp.]|nr:hypothetical protein [Candidatus Acidoferrum sp.]
MKPSLSCFTLARTARVLPLVLGLCLCAGAVRGASFIWRNTGQIVFLGAGYSGNTVPAPPQIDATNFYNSGLMYLLIYPYKPFLTQDTLNFTNASSGDMEGIIGWEFDYGPPNGGRSMAANFVNNGTIASFSGGLPNPLSSPFTSPVGYLWISATNINNKGNLVADTSCEIKLNGSNVNLSRSAIQIQPLSGIGSANGPTNFTADTSIYDEQWAATNRNDLHSEAVWDGTNVALPPYTPFDVAEPCPVTPPDSVMLGFVPAVADSVTNQVFGFISVTNSTGGSSIVILATNIYRQAAFVYSSDSTIVGAIGFTRTGNISNLFETMTVQLTSSSVGDSVYVVDDLGYAPAHGLIMNNTIQPSAQCANPTYRPTNYIVERVDFNGLGSSGNGWPTTNFFYETGWSNTAVVAAYSVYTGLVDNQATEPPNNPGSLVPFSSVTNLSGRVRIYADSLNLSNATIRAEGEVTVQANHLLSSQSAVMNCENFSYNIGAPAGGNITVSNLVPASVNRFNGEFTAVSAVWSNLAFVTLTNYAPVATNITSGTNTVTVTNWVRSDLTNIVVINLWMLAVDGSALSSVKPVTVYNFTLHGTNQVLNDPMTVIENFFLDGQSLTINGSLTFPGVVPVNPLTLTPFAPYAILNWTYDFTPNLRYFTNNGTISVPNEAHFGDDGPVNYLAFVNTGTISASVEYVNSLYLENDGLLSSGYGVYLNAGSGKFQNGQISAGSDIQFNASDFKFTQSTIQTTGGELDFSVTDSLSDAGPGSGNGFTCSFGFNLWSKPALGDLLGSTFTSVAYGDTGVSHTWAGNNYGTSNNGYTNNVALGTLLLFPHGDNVFYFTGAGANNGLYVDYLDLSLLGSNYLSELQIDTNLVIYYAAAALGFTPPPAGPGLPPQEPEEYLDGQFGGHLRWVKSYAGPNSSVAVVINGQTYIVNKALRFATTIDSNTNGIPNYADPNPFSVPPPFSTSVFTLQFSLVPPGQMIPKLKQTNLAPSSVVALSWLAASNRVYTVQYTTNLAPAAWKTLATYTNKTTTNQVPTVLDTNAPVGTTRRFYRVGYGP